jgi:hypothetical protein
MVDTSLLHGRKAFLPKVPISLEEEADLRDYLQKLVDAIENLYTKLADNDSDVAGKIPDVDADEVVLGPSSTTENNVPQWDATDRTLKDGLAVGTAANNLVERTSSQHIEFNQKQGLQFVVENRTADPASPVAGQMWFRTDL